MLNGWLPTVTSATTVSVLVSIPVACTGGMLALLITRTNFSVSAAMGFISIFGIAIQDAILVVTYAQRQWADGKSLEEGARAAAEQLFAKPKDAAKVSAAEFTPALIERQSTAPPPAAPSRRG